MTKQAGQKGCYDIQRGSWVLRYREKVVENGISKTMLRAHKLGSLEAFPPKRHKSTAQAADRASRLGVPNEILTLGNQFLASLNLQHKTLKGSLRLSEFIETIYFPRIEQAQKKPSTVKSYRNIYQYHFKDRVAGVWLRDVIPANVQDWLYDIEAHDKTEDHLTLTHVSLSHIKNFLSGVFKLAKQEGYLSSVNPVADVAIPKGRTSDPTQVYDFKEARTMIALLPRPASTVLAVAAFAGLRASEIRGLLWENYDGASLHVTQSVVGKHIGTPKTVASGDAVPVIPELKRHLDLWRVDCEKPTTGLVFQSTTGTPLDLNNLMNRVLMPAIKKAEQTGLRWKGYHAFRRGLATNLHDIGVNDLTIQLILRHSDVNTTRKSYIKRLPQQAIDAMKLVQAQFDEAPATRQHDEHATALIQ
jgi:integrase